MFRWFHQVKIIIVYNWVVSLLLWWIYHIKIYHFFRGHSSISQSFMVEGRRGEPNDHKGEGMSYDHTGSQWGGGIILQKYTQIKPNDHRWSQGGGSALWSHWITVGWGVSNWEKYTQIRPKYTKKQDQIQFY